MIDLWLAAAVMAAVTAVAFAAGLVLGRRLGPRAGASAAFAACAFVVAFALHLSDHLFFTRLLPFSNVIVLADWLPKAWLAVGLADFAGAVWTTLELRWRPKPKTA